MSWLQEDPFAIHGGVRYYLLRLEQGNFNMAKQFSPGFFKDFKGDSLATIAKYMDHALLDAAGQVLPTREWTLTVSTFDDIYDRTVEL